MFRSDFPIAHPLSHAFLALGEFAAQPPLRVLLSFGVGSFVELLVNFLVEPTLIFIDWLQSVMY
jgi:hypothetical protein